MKSTKIAIGSDHAGFAAKEELKKFLEEKNYEVIDCGTDSENSCDYPDYGKKVAFAIKEQKADFGVVICGTGIGISIAANKVKGIRAGIAYTDEVASLIRQHNNCQIIAFGARFMNIDDMKRRLEIFLNSEFEGGRHLRRVNKIEEVVVE